MKVPRDGVAAGRGGGQPAPPRRGHRQHLGPLRHLRLRPACAARAQEGVRGEPAGPGPRHLRRIRSLLYTERG